MSGSISRIMAKAYKNVLSNPREAKFAFRMQQLFAKSEKRRKKVKEQEGIFEESASLGINFALLAGGEPMMRKDILEAVAEVKDMILAAGRGFFHIGPDGSAEPCPFSPFSDSSVTELGVKGALASPLFRKLRDVHLVGGEHSGGCALYEHREEVAKMIEQS